MNMKDDEVQGLVEAMKPMDIGKKSKSSRFRRTPIVVSVIIGLLHQRWTTPALFVSILGISAAIFVHVCPSPILPVEYQCPSVVHQSAENVDESVFDAEYVQAQSLLTANLTLWMENFRSSPYDDWGQSYDEVKEGMRAFKTRFLVPNIKTGQSIYESACGIGLNLYMTLELLAEAGITGIHVYGNEYLSFSTDKANLLFDAAPPAEATKGRICTGDSSNLSWVPSNSFDLVYTGYISPLLNPLLFDFGDVDANFAEYTNLCRAAKKRGMWKEKKLTELAQEKQSEFYAKWVGEMIRIAKPGSAVLVEQVSVPYCEDFNDWGGVNESWWSATIQRYGWDVNPKTLVFVNDTIFRHRYHVFLRKNYETI